LPIKAEVKAETSDVMKSVDEDRKYVIQATIVRIMKARKTMKNQPLIQEVISQISQRFAPKIPDIKKAIDTLLEKEYIERVEGTRDTFNYVVSTLLRLTVMEAYGCYRLDLVSSISLGDLVVSNHSSSLHYQSHFMPRCSICNKFRIECLYISECWA
jgi:hypothetical protein